MARPLGNLPTNDEKLAMAGDFYAFTPPSGAEPFVTNSDPGVGVSGILANTSAVLGSTTNITTTSYVSVLSVNYTATKFQEWVLVANVLLDAGTYLANLQLWDESGPLTTYGAAFNGVQNQRSWTNSPGSTAKETEFLFAFGTYNLGQNKTFHIMVASNNGGSDSVPVLAGTNMSLLV